MRLYYILLLLPLISFSCNDAPVPVNEKFFIEDDHPLPGKWKFIGSSFSTGSSDQIFEEVENGYEYVFDERGRFTTNTKISKMNNDNGSFENEIYCPNGLYELQNNILILKFICKKEIIEYQYLFSFSEGHLELVPYSPVMCIEGCFNRFKKLE